MPRSALAVGLLCFIRPSAAACDWFCSAQPRSVRCQWKSMCDSCEECSTQRVASQSNTELATPPPMPVSPTEPPTDKSYNDILNDIPVGVMRSLVVDPRFEYVKMEGDAKRSNAFDFTFAAQRKKSPGVKCEDLDTDAAKHDFSVKFIRVLDDNSVNVPMSSLTVNVLCPESLLEDELKQAKEELTSPGTGRIVSKRAIVRDSVQVSSGHVVKELQEGAQIVVAELRELSAGKIRARITEPVEGWLSLRAADGRLIVAEARATGNTVNAVVSVEIATAPPTKGPTTGPTAAPVVSMRPYLPMGRDVSVLSCEDWELVGEAFGSKAKGDKRQWFRSFAVHMGSQEIARVGIREEPNDIERSTSENAFAIAAHEARLRAKAMLADAAAQQVPEEGGDWWTARVPWAAPWAESPRNKRKKGQLRGAPETLIQREAGRTLTTVNVTIDGKRLTATGTETFRTIGDGQKHTREISKAAENTDAVVIVSQDRTIKLGIGAYSETVSIGAANFGIELTSGINKVEGDLRMHIELRFTQLNLTACDGPFAEIWGAAPVSLETAKILIGQDGPLPKHSPDDFKPGARRHSKLIEDSHSKPIKVESEETTPYKDIGEGYCATFKELGRYLGEEGCHEAAAFDGACVDKRTVSYGKGANAGKCLCDMVADCSVMLGTTLDDNGYDRLQWPAPKEAVCNGGYIQISVATYCKSTFLWAGEDPHCWARCDADPHCKFYTSYGGDWCQTAETCSGSVAAADNSAATFTRCETTLPPTGTPFPTNINTEAPTSGTPPQPEKIWEVVQDFKEVVEEQVQDSNQQTAEVPPLPTLPPIVKPTPMPTPVPTEEPTLPPTPSPPKPLAAHIAERRRAISDRLRANLRVERAKKIVQGVVDKASSALTQMKQRKWTLKCESWCADHEDPWSTKCAWDNGVCKGCHQCAPGKTEVGAKQPTAAGRENDEEEGDAELKPAERTKLWDVIHKAVRKSNEVASAADAAEPNVPDQEASGGDANTTKRSGLWDMVRGAVAAGEVQGLGEAGNPDEQSSTEVAQSKAAGLWDLVRHAVPDVTKQQPQNTLLQEILHHSQPHSEQEPQPPEQSLNDWLSRRAQAPPKPTSPLPTVNATTPQPPSRNDTEPNEPKKAVTFALPVSASSFAQVATGSHCSNEPLFEGVDNNCKTRCSGDLNCGYYTTYAGGNCRLFTTCTRMIAADFGDAATFVKFST